MEKKKLIGWHLLCSSQISILLQLPNAIISSKSFQTHKIKLEKKKSWGKKPIFSSANASFSIALKIPCESYLNINKPRGCARSKKKEEGNLQSLKFAAQAQMTQTDGSSRSLDGGKMRLKAKKKQKNLRGMKFEWAREGLCFSSSLCLPSQGVDSGRLKTLYLRERFALPDVYFTAGVGSPRDVARSELRQ